MKNKEKNRTYRQISPSKELQDFVEIYWEYKNLDDSPNKMTILPDSFFKLIVYITKGKTTAYFLTGIWTKDIEITVPSQGIVYGIKFKILAPEYIFKEEIASLLLSHRDLSTNFFNIKSIDFDSFENIVNNFEKILITQLNTGKPVESRKLQLSQLLYKMKGEISANEVSKQIYWENRQINRYLNKYLGISLKKYLNMQKLYAAYIQIREGRFFPEKGYYDQPHFIRETKKYTGKTPKELFQEQNDRFIQLKNIQSK